MNPLRKETAITSTLRVFVFLILGLALLSSPSVAYAAGTVGTGTPGSCTQAALDTALTGGGTVTFDCGGAAHTINITTTKVIAANTIINGVGENITLDGGDSVRLFTVNAGSTLSLANLTLTDGQSPDGGVVYANGDLTISSSTITSSRAVGAGDNEGGAIYANNITLDISNSIFSGNRSEDNGGYIYVNGASSDVDITNTTFQNQTNTSPELGGVIYQNGGTLDITGGSLFINNNTRNDGGAIWFGGTALTIDNTTFENQSNTAINDGGAIFVNAGNVSISNSTFKNNRAQGGGGDGGAIFFTGGGTHTISGSTFDGNISNDDGGAIFLNNGSLSISANTEFKNHTNATIDRGGAIYVEGGTLSVTDGVFTSNYADDGGAIFHNSGTLLTLTDTTFTGNRASVENNGDGGALMMNDALASATISGCTFTNNLANDDGGAIQSAAEPMTITNTTFDSNTAEGRANDDALGGAFSNLAAADGTTITLSTFTDNLAHQRNLSQNDDAYGGAIYNNGGENFVIANVTFSGNTADKDHTGNRHALGGAIWSNASMNVYNSTFSGNTVTNAGTGSVNGGNIFRQAGALTVANSILTGGTANGAYDNCGGTITDGGNNIDYSAGGANDCGAGFTDDNPDLDTATGTPEYFPLQLTSPAIDTGNNTICANASVNNESQNGVTRPANGGVSLTCDIGSFELEASPPEVTINEAAAQADPTSVSPINFTVVFSELVNGFASGDVTLSGGAGATTDTVTEIAPNDGTTYNVAVSGMTGSGTVIATIGAGVATNGGGLGNEASTSSDNTVTYDPGPTVTINQAATQLDPTSISPIYFTVVFSEDVDGFASGDVTLSGSAGATTDVVTELPPYDGTTYEVAVSGMTGNGTVIATVGAGVATDGDSIGNQASTSTDNTVTFDSAVDNPPIIYDWDSPDPSYTEKAPPIRLDVDVTIIDLDTFDLTGTTITLSFLPYQGTMGFPEDQLGIGNYALITTDGSDVLYSGIVIGTFSGGANGTPLVVTLNDNADDERMGWLASAFTYHNTSGNPTLNGTTPTQDRRLRLQTSQGGNTDTDDDKYIDILAGVAPEVIINGINSAADTGDGFIAEGEIVTVGVSQLLITFDEDMDNSTAGDEVTNVNNYFLISEGTVLGFQSSSCSVIKSTGVDPDDMQITINSVSYDSNTYTATLNLGGTLPNGLYRLVVCGTATLRDLQGLALAGDGVNAGTDFTRNFEVELAPEEEDGAGSALIPATGFAPGVVTKLDIQPAVKSYADYGDLWLEIPKLGQSMSIVGVPLVESEWEVTWLGRQAGYLEGTAFPTFAGNTGITAHVWDADNNPGPFANLRKLQHGDVVKIHAWGQVYTYSVRYNYLTTPGNTTSLRSEEFDWVTLLTCERYSPTNNSYRFRRVVRAVLLDVSPE